MGLILKRGRDGNFRRHWYGKYEIDDITRVVNLNVRVKGTPPPSLRDLGDAVFERSRAVAEKVFEGVVEEAKQKGRAAHLTERLIESKTGEHVEYVKVADLGARWRAGSPGCEKHLLHTDATFRDFAAYAGEHQPDAAFCYAVTRQTVEEYADQLRRTLAPATARRKLRLMKGAFARSLPIGARNPFDPLPWTRGDGTGEEVHRRPLTPDELTRLLEVARQDQFMFPLVTTAACTGMRRGDVCRLRWDAVDMAEGMLAVRTDKTGERVEIPIFAPLRVVLETAQANRKPDAVYVWPEAVNLIENTPNLLTRMFKKLAVEAFREASVEPSLPSPPPVARVSLTEVLSAVETAILAGRPEGARRDRIIDNVRRYASGETVRGIEKATGRARGQVSEDLHEAQRLSGLPFMPPPHVAVRAEATIAKVTRQARPSGQRAASIVDWHCLRTSFVTLALSAGVPVETLQLVTGHRTVAVVLANYYRPQRAHLRAALTNVMPEVLTGKKSVQVPSPEKELQELTAKLANGTATEADRVRFRELAAAV